MPEIKILKFCGLGLGIDYPGACTGNEKTGTFPLSLSFNKQLMILLCYYIFNISVLGTGQSTSMEGHLSTVRFNKHAT